MGTAQMVRNQTVSWSSIFPPEQVTEQQSALFVKKLLAVAVSSVTYLRAIFPEHAFGDRCLEDLNLKILKDDSACPGACQVIQWIKGCFDALDKKYLKNIVIGIYVDPEDPDTVIESYTFKFSYNKEGMSIYRNGSKIASAYTEAETKKATIRLLRTIILLTQTLKSLPDEVMMTMKLLYYDEDTPADYQPPGFKESLNDSFAFLEDPMNIKIGDVSTPFHTVKLRIKTDCHQFEIKEDEEKECDEEKMEEEEDQEEELPNEKDLENRKPDHELELSKTDIKGEEGNSQQNAEKVIGDTTKDEKINECELEGNQELPSTPSSLKKQKSKRRSSQQVVPESEVMECEEVPLSSPNVPGVSDVAEGCDTHASTSLSIDSQMTQDQDEAISVKCPCGYNEDDGLMILCGICDNWQHAVCFGILEEEEAPELHICVACAQKGKEGKKCTDPLLTELDSVNVQATSLWRRALLASTEMNRILPTTLARRLGTEMTVAQGLLHRLEKEGFIKSALKGKRLGKIVNKGKVKKEGLKKYFSGTENVSLTQRVAKVEEIDSTAENKGIDNITKKASELDVSGKLRPRTPKSDLIASDADLTPSRRKSQRIAKRAISLVDESADFEISNSQDTLDDTHKCGSKRRKASVAARAILV